MTPIDSQALLDRSVKSLEDAVAKAGGAENLTEETMPEAHIRGDVNTPYKCIGGTIFTMQRAGFARVGFVSEPPAGSTVQRL
jgi:biopolymer transport protein ExbD